MRALAKMLASSTIFTGAYPPPEFSSLLADRVASAKMESSSSGSSLVKQSLILNILRKNRCLALSICSNLLTVTITTIGTPLPFMSEVFLAATKIMFLSEIEIDRRKWYMLLSMAYMSHPYCQALTFQPFQSTLPSLRIRKQDGVPHLLAQHTFHRFSVRQFFL